MSASSPSPFKGGGFAKTLDLYALCDISELRSNEPVACGIGFEDESFARDTERWGIMRFYEKHCRRIIAKALVP